MASRRSQISQINIAGKEDHFKSNQPKATDFELFLPWACNEFSIDVDIIITKTTQEVYVGVASAKKGTSKKSISTISTRKSTKPITIDLDSDDDMSVANAKTVNDLENAIRIKTIYDCHENLVQIQFLQNKVIPQKVIKVLGLAIPYHNLLTSITINSGLRMDTLYEISKLLPDSYITELCLDGTVFSQANYHILLTFGKLKYLSLSKCSINDVVVKTITDQLGDRSPASRVLSALNLSSNNITDDGAKYVAGMLRTNRHLSYLNIAGNLITDEGGMSILDTLQKFPLGSQECLESKDRYVAYLKKKNELIEKMIKELQTDKGNNILKKKGVRRSKMSLGWRSVLNSGAEARLIQEKAEGLAAIEMGSFDDPFSPDNTKSQDGAVHCFGNNTLCYLNLAYNNLTYASVRKLLEVLRMQRQLHRIPKGLIKVVIEGNLMPVDCEEYEEINRLFADSVRVPRGSNLKAKFAKSSTRHII